MTYKIKLICGFRTDQQHTIDSEEAHKAYYLFLNPGSRGIFNDGLAISGSEIKQIVPDYNATMGWNPSHILDGDDWNEIRRDGVENKIRDLLYASKQVAASLKPSDMNRNLSEILEQDQKKNLMP